MLFRSELTQFAEAHQIPVIETIAGRANLLNDHALNIGPVGVTGSDSANSVAERADVILSVGSRLQDFTTGSWTAFAQDAKLISLNAARHDAGKHKSLPIVGDAKLGLQQLSGAMNGYKAPSSLTEYAIGVRKELDAYVAGNVSVDNGPNSYAKAI